MNNAIPPFTESPEEVARGLGVSLEVGLSQEEATARQQRFGLNSLPAPPPPSRLRIFARQFSSVLILILLGAAILSAAIGNTKDATAIACVVLINACVGFFQEYRAEQSLAVLKQMLPSSARVRRDGHLVEVPADALVPGDVLLVEAGDRIAADGRVITAPNLDIDESSLTGESAPVPKRSEQLTATNVAIGDRVCMAFMNTLVTRGRAEILVTATGEATEVGKLSRQLAEAEEPASVLQVQIDRLGKRLGAIAITLVALLSFLELLRGTELAHVVLDAIALAVAAMPEGLPVVVTVTLGVGMQQLARQRAIVKRLASVETLGCTTVICSDKTGTLTLNEMTVRAVYFAGRFFDVSGEGYRTQGEIRAVGDADPDSDPAPLLVAGVACNDSRLVGERAIGDPMEAALLAVAAKAGIDQKVISQELPRIAEVPFESSSKFMATFHQAGDQVCMYVKGAPDVLLARCTLERSINGTRPLEKGRSEELAEVYASLGARGYRGLLIASKSFPAVDFKASEDLGHRVTDLTFLGLVGIVDPPRPEAKDAIARCRDAGIAVKMITGDHKSTALAIARVLGVDGVALSGSELDEIDSVQIQATIDRVTVFARVAPEHKVKIVRVLQGQGHVVAMTGDGVNDAPALKIADIGIAMGINGTAVAKEAATMVLTDDNFATIVSAIRRGRILYDNILKFVRFQLSTTIGTVLTVFFAPLAGLPEPFTPLQILWIAIIMDGPPAISLAFDAARPGIMREPPRKRDASVLPLPRLTKIFAYGLTMMAGTLGVLHYGLQMFSHREALSLAFTTFVLFQFFNIFNARVESRSAFNARFFDNRMLWASLAGVVALQWLAVQWEPAVRLFGTAPLTAWQWVLAVLVASSVLWLEEARKLFLWLVRVVRIPRRRRV